MVVLEHLLYGILYHRDPTSRRISGQQTLLKVSLLRFHLKLDPLLVKISGVHGTITIVAQQHRDDPRRQTHDRAEH